MNINFFKDKDIAISISTILVDFKKAVNVDQCARMFVF
jgi:hypothetical protein